MSRGRSIRRTLLALAAITAATALSGCGGQRRVPCEGPCGTVSYHGSSPCAEGGYGGPYRVYPCPTAVRPSWPACGSPSTSNGWYTATAPYRRGYTRDYHRSCNGY